MGSDDMSDTQCSQQTDVEELITVLMDERCAAVVSFFRNYSGDSASVETLASVLSDPNGRVQHRFTVELHHVALPTLAETGVITYDIDTNIVEYHGHPAMDEVTAHLEALC